MKQQREESGLACKKRRPSCFRPSPPIAPTRDGPETGVLGGGSEQAGPLHAAFRILKEAPQLPGKRKAKGLSEERRWWEEGLGKTAQEMADGVGGGGWSSRDRDMGRSNGHKDSMRPIITLLFPATHLSEESQGLWKETLRSRQMAC